MHPRRRGELGGVDEFVFLGQTDTAINICGAVAVSDGNNGVNSGSAGARDHFVAVGVELVAVEMCVGVDEHGVGRVSLVFRPRSSVFDLWHFCMDSRAEIG